MITLDDKEFYILQIDIEKVENFFDFSKFFAPTDWAVINAAEGIDLIFIQNPYKKHKTLQWEELRDIIDKLVRIKLFYVDLKVTPENYQHMLFNLSMGFDVFYNVPLLGEDNALYVEY